MPRLLRRAVALGVLAVTALTIAPAWGSTASAHGVWQRRLESVNQRIELLRAQSERMGMRARHELDRKAVWVRQNLPTVRRRFDAAEDALRQACRRAASHLRA